MQLIFVKKKKSQEGGPKAVPGAPTQAAVINPWVADTASASLEVHQSQSLLPAGFVHLNRFICTSSAALDKP